MTADGVDPGPVRRALAAAGGPGLAICAALVVGGLLMLATGHDPLAAYVALVEGALGGRGGGNLLATLNRSAPIVGMGLAAALAFRAGFFNLGGEGQLVLGAMSGTLVALALPLPAPLLSATALFAGCLAGAAWAGLGAWLHFRFRVSLLLGTLLLSYPARAVTSYLVSHPLRDVASGMAQSHLLPPAAELPRLGPRLQLSLIVVTSLVLLAALLMRRTAFGYELTMSGLSSRFVRYGGVDDRRLGYRAMLLSGGMAGLVGALQVLAVHRRFIDGALVGPLYAWIGVMVALLVRSRPLAVLAGGVFFAALQTGALGMERSTDVPRELSQVLQALVLLFVAAQASPRGGGGEA